MASISSHSFSPVNGRVITDHSRKKRTREYVIMTVKGPDHHIPIVAKRFLPARPSGAKGMVTLPTKMAIAIWHALNRKD